MVLTNVHPDSKHVVDCTEETEQAYQLGHAFFNIQRNSKFSKAVVADLKKEKGVKS